jgi:hypothetical protein
MIKLRRAIPITVGLFSFTTLLLNVPALAAQNQGGPDAVGGVCHVVNGSNKGKTGTYDGDGACCNEGPSGWGCTECNGSHAGYCKDGPAKSVKAGTGKIQPSGEKTLQKSP